MGQTDHISDEPQLLGQSQNLVAGNVMGQAEGCRITRHESNSPGGVIPP